MEYQSDSFQESEDFKAAAQVKSKLILSQKAT